MRSISESLQRYGYGVFVTALVMMLGFFSWRLREQDSPAVSEPITLEHADAPSPTISPTASPVPEPVWLRPVAGGMLAPFQDAVPVWNASMDCWQIHSGVDFAAAAGEAVQATADGEVMQVLEDPLLGNTVVLQHSGGWQSVYASLDSASVQLWQRVKAGEAIGRAGSSADSECLLGCHVHFELLKDDVPVRPVFTGGK